MRAHFAVLLSTVMVAIPAISAHAAGARQAGEPSCSCTAADRQAATLCSNPGRTFAAPPPFLLDPGVQYTATIQTASGDIVINLDAQAAPIAVNNFVFLACSHFYDGLTFYRVIPGFVAQAGDPNGDGTGGPGYTIPDDPSPLPHTTGAVGLAELNAPNTGGSQFFITLAPQPAFDGQYPVFGNVVSGLEILEALPGNTPLQPAAAPLQISTIVIAEQ